jgi:hypothetical protein
MKSLQAMVIASILLGAALSFGGNPAAQYAGTRSLPYQIILHTVGDVDGFGFGLDVCPLGCALPEVPAGSGDPAPFDTSDTPCALTRTWTHDFAADLPSGAQVVSAVLMVNAAGIQPEVFPSVLTADSTVLPLTYFNQGERGSGIVPVPLEPADLMDGVLQVTVRKGQQVRGTTVCDVQFYDASALVVLISRP